MDFGVIPGYDPAATAGDCRFDEQAAQRAVGFFEKFLRHVKGELACQPFVLQPWQKAIVANLFGWKRPDGSRRYREAFILVPRKNGKSLLSAGVIVYTLYTDAEPGAELYSAAAERDQARLVFEMVRSMIESDPDLVPRAEIYKYSIIVGTASYKAISADAHTKHGFNSHLVVVDELHAQTSRDLVDVLRTSMGARRQPLLISITTSDYDRQSICNEKYDYACKVRDGTLPDPSFLPVIYEAKPDDDWTDEAVWKKANPNYGVSLSPDYLRAECEKAKTIPAYTNTFRRLHLNVRTKQANLWLPMDTWRAGAGEVEVGSLVGLPCCGGLDLSSKHDLTALVWVFRVGNVYKLLPRFWVPGERATERERNDRVPYGRWRELGFVEFTPGNVVDYDVIEKAIQEDSKRFKVRELAFDPWNATHVATHLDTWGVKMIEFTQTIKSFNEPCKEFEKLLLEGRLHHGNHPLLSWCAENVEVKTDVSGNIRPVKPEHASCNRIDGIVAAVMGLSRWVLQPEKKQSIYATRGVLYA